MPTRICNRCFHRLVKCQVGLVLHRLARVAMAPHLPASTVRPVVVVERGHMAGSVSRTIVDQEVATTLAARRVVTAAHNTHLPVLVVHRVVVTRAVVGVAAPIQVRLVKATTPQVVGVEEHLATTPDQVPHRTVIQVDQEVILQVQVREVLQGVAVEDILGGRQGDLRVVLVALIVVQVVPMEVQADLMAVQEVLMEDQGDLMEDRADLTEDQVDLTEDRVDLTEDRVDLTEGRVDHTEDRVDHMVVLGDPMEHLADLMVEVMDLTAAHTVHLVVHMVALVAHIVVRMAGRLVHIVARVDLIMFQVDRMEDQVVLTDLIPDLVVRTDHTAGQELLMEVHPI